MVGDVLLHEKVAQSGQMLDETWQYDHLFAQVRDEIEGSRSCAGKPGSNSWRDVNWDCQDIQASNGAYESRRQSGQCRVRCSSSCDQSCIG